MKGQKYFSLTDLELARLKATPVAMGRTCKQRKQNKIRLKNSLRHLAIMEKRYKDLSDSFTQINKFANIKLTRNKF